MMFGPYPRHKPTGTQWPMSAPEHWDVTPLKIAVVLLTEKTDRRNHPVVLDNIESWTGRFRGTSGVFEGDGVAFEPGDILFGKLRPYLAKVHLAETAGEAVGDFHVLRARSRHYSGFIKYLLLAREFISLADGSTFGSKMPRVSWEFMGSTKVAMPPFYEQVTIAHFLDRELETLDTVTVEHERLIELLEEKRQAVISHAVARGLNSDVRMKPSGVSRLGDIPVHWELRRLSTLSTKITNGYVGPTREILVSEGVRYLQSLHIKNNSIEFNQPYYVSPEWSVKHGKSVLHSGDVLIVQTGDIGHVALVTDEFAGCNCHALIVVAPLATVVSGDWLSWVLTSDYGNQCLRSIQTGALHPHLNCGNVKDIDIPVPPKAEQSHIVRFIAEQLSHLRTLRDEAEKAVELLQERRQALISAAVTGQVDVRNYKSSKVA